MEYIIRIGSLQLLCNQPPVDCNSSAILLADNSYYILETKQLAGGNARVEQLEESDPRRVTATALSTAKRPIFDITTVEEGVWRIASHNGSKIVTLSGKKTLHVSPGNQATQFGSGNNMTIDF